MFIYSVYIRPILEYAVPVWGSSLTLRQSSEIERVQKRALGMICYPTDSHYDDLLHQFDISSLDSRRVEILKRFAKSLLGSLRHRHLLPQPRHVTTCRSLRNSDHLSPPRCRTQRYKQSTVPSLVHLLNSIN